VFQNDERVYFIGARLHDFRQRFPDAFSVEIDFYKVLRNRVEFNSDSVLTCDFNLRLIV
jgi:hypothetical protein